ncbi:unnamed protein product, partial [Rotaria sp. Silwood2]
MASNVPSESWSVKIEPIPVNISFIDLAQAINLPKSSIWIPKTHKNNDNYAWINGFASKEEAD